MKLYILSALLETPKGTDHKLGYRVCADEMTARGLFVTNIFELEKNVKITALTSTELPDIAMCRALGLLEEKN